jgi:CRISPR-associated protein Csb2
MRGEATAMLGGERSRDSASRDAAPVVWRIECGRPIPIGESLAVAQSLHVALLALAGRHFGADAIPSVLSGRAVDGRPLHASRQHRHKHVLVDVGGSGTLDRVAIWAPDGLTQEERAVVAGARLRWEGRFVVLTTTSVGGHAAFATARSWRSLTPYLPFNHVKPRGANSVEGQVRRELVEFRGLGEPATITVDPWTRGRFRLSRANGRREGPPPVPHDVHITFEEPVMGPLTLGRHAHFSLGLMIPDDA